MFRHPAWAVGSYSRGPPVARTIGTKSTGGFYRLDLSPCRVIDIQAVVARFPECPVVLPSTAAAAVAVEDEVDGERRGLLRRHRVHVRVPQAARLPEQRRERRRR